MVSNIMNTVAVSTNEYSPEADREWMRRNWLWSIPATVLYLLAIRYGQKFMSKRPAYDLKLLLILWNASLAIFSAVAFVNIAPELWDVLRTDGLYGSFCKVGEQFHNAAGYWQFLFVLSKYPELLDTAFLVLRKRPVIFLHSFHHASVLIFSCYQARVATSCARWGVTLNTFVHSLMYTYYALRAAGRRVPKVVSVTITLLQIGQMLILSYLSTVILFKSVGKTDLACEMRSSVALFQAFIFFSYLALFLNFFYKSYVSPRKVKPQ